MSTLFLRTLREDPSDAEVPSHRFLVRAGYIRRVSPGIYTWLPLGLMVLKRVEEIIREEMNAIGAQELLFPALLPREPYDATGRWTDYGDNIFRLQDRKGADYLLGPTHEELFTLTVKDMYTSYKDLPVSLYQIQTKYRDEARPRAGILRGREFIMKDSYSFDIDDAGLERSYQAHREAYIRIFDRLGFDYAIVSAMAGAMGGSRSEEFLATAANGEDSYVRCPGCDYAANVEAFEVASPAPVPFDDVAPARVVDTPQTPTIDTLVAVLNDNHPRDDSRAWQASDTLKNVVVTLVQPDGSREPLVIGIPGDRAVDDKRLAAQVEPATVEAFTDEDFASHPELVRGYIGPQVLGENSSSGVRYLVDPRVAPGTVWATGANEEGRHVVSLVAGRDFVGDGTIEAAEVLPGDPCPGCGQAVEIARGIEMGHIFQLGRRYADALGLQVLDESGKLVTVTMGSYGVGVSRAVAAVAEANHDDVGLIWPRDLSPVDVHIVAAGKDQPIYDAAANLAKDLQERGLRVLIDDRRGASPGVKFKDAELIGVPTIVVVGRGLADGTIEVRDRASGDASVVGLDEAVSTIVDQVRAS